MLKPIELALSLDDLIDCGGFSTPSFLLVVNIPGFWVDYHSCRLLTLAGPRLTIRSWFFRPLWSLQQGSGGCLLAGLDGLLPQLCTPIHKSMIEPDGKLPT